MYQFGGYDIDEISDAIKVRDGAGFYVGLLGNFMLTEKLYAQPEVLYTNVGGDGGIVIPLVAKYYIAEQFNLQAGPQFEFLLDVSDVEDITIKKSGVSLALGAGFDIDEKFAIQATYSIGLTDYIDTNISDLIPDDIIGSILNPELKINSFKVGLVYKFN